MKTTITLDESDLKAIIIAHQLKAKKPVKGDVTFEVVDEHGDAIADPHVEVSFVLDTTMGRDDRMDPKP